MSECQIPGNARFQEMPDSRMPENARMPENTSFQEVPKLGYLGI